MIIDGPSSFGWSPRKEDVKKERAEAAGSVWDLWKKNAQQGGRSCVLADSRGSGLNGHPRGAGEAERERAREKVGVARSPWEASVSGLFWKRARRLPCDPASLLSVFRSPSSSHHTKNHLKNTQVTHNLNTIMSASAESFLTSDAQLAANDAVKAAHAKYSKVASDAVIEKTKAALEKKNHGVTVVANKEEALSTLVGLIPEGVTIHNTSSTTLVRPLPVSSS
jgi:hypothetical protein